MVLVLKHHILELLFCFSIILSSSLLASSMHEERGFLRFRYVSTHNSHDGSESITKKEPLSTSYGLDTINRKSFPDGFIFGTGSSAYQIEGGWNEGGRGPSIWDTFTHEHPEKIDDRSNGNVACNSFNKYKDDIKLLKDMNMDSYRFSLSWSRILPSGKLSGGVNEQGIKYYNELIDELLANGIVPYVTLFHWDAPQALEDEYGGFLSPKIVKDFVDYVDVCFKAFGDRVKLWATLNEPWTYSTEGYSIGHKPPGRCSPFLNCSAGNSATEPYLVTHNQIIAHASAVKLYKDKYQASQKGKIGIALVSMWMVPLTSSSSDRSSSIRAQDFMLGWYMNPLVHGKYPSVMRSLVRERLPKFTKEESILVKGSFDYIGINYYTAVYTSSASPSEKENISYGTDSLVTQLYERNGIPIGEQAGSDWLHVYPKGLRDLLVYIKKKYQNPVLYITENGVNEKDDENLPLEEALKDNLRVKYYHSHLSNVHKAIKEGVNVRAYFAWSATDNFEWTNGYTLRFGLNYVDFRDGQKRYPKLSSRWITNFLKK